MTPNTVLDLQSSDPVVFARGLRDIGLEPCDCGTAFRRRCGHHRIIARAGHGSGLPTAANWAVELELNGARFNRWTAANFFTAGHAVEYAVEHVEALQAIAAKPRAPAGIDPAVWAVLQPLGFDIEGGGAGIPFASYYAQGAGHALITGSDGADLPDVHSWMVGVYGPGDLGELQPLWTETSGEAGATLAALGSAAERAVIAARLATPEAVEAGLTDELRAYCEAHSLPLMSADELACEVEAALRGDAGRVAIPTGPKRCAELQAALKWLRGFCGRWEAVTDTHDRVRREGHPQPTHEALEKAEPAPAEPATPARLLASLEAMLTVHRPAATSPRDAAILAEARATVAAAKAEG